MSRVAITAYKLVSLAIASFEIIDDSTLSTQLPTPANIAFDVEENTLFSTGAGSGSSQPWGLVTVVSATTASVVSATTAGTFTSASVGDIFKTDQAVTPRARSSGNYSWWSSRTVQNVVRTMSPNGQGSSFINTLADGDATNGIPRMLGGNYYETSGMVATTTTGSSILIAGDAKRFAIYDRLGVRAEFIPSMLDPTTSRPTGERSWMFWKRTGSNVLDPGSFALLKT